MFRLSNDMIQSIFDDGSELMFNSITKFITYVSKTGEKIHSELGLMQRENNIEMQQRFNYVREVLVISKGFRIKTKDE